MAKSATSDVTAVDESEVLGDWIPRRTLEERLEIRGL